MPEPVYLTASGIAAAHAELDDLVAVERPAVVARIKAARELGDLSENADYEVARREQSILEGRIEHLSQILRDAVVIAAASTEQVTRGSTVTVADDEDGKELTYTVVGGHEARPAEGRISGDSPVGRALLGRRAGRNTVTVSAPAGPFALRILRLG